MEDPENPQKQAAEDTSTQLRVIQVFVQGRDLKNLDEGRDKSDTQTILKMKWHANQADWLEVDHTEVIHDNLNPNYAHHFEVIYNFGQQCQLRFEVVDLDSDGTVQPIGGHECTLVDLVRQSSDEPYIRNLTGQYEEAGSITLMAEEKRNASQKIVLDLEVNDLPE